MDKITTLMRYIVVAFIVGAAVYFVKPEVIKKEVEIVEVEKEVEKIIEVEIEKLVETTIVKEILVASKKTTRKITYPDGTVIEESIEESSTQQLDRLKESLSISYDAKLQEKEKEIENLRKTTITKTNTKRAMLNFGYDVLSQNYAVGTHYNVWGPFTIGATVTTNGEVYPSVGIKF